jgi:hypothetical protein
VEKVVPQKLATFDIFKQLTDVNNHPMYENSPNLVTLTLMKKKLFFRKKDCCHSFRLCWQRQGDQIGRLFAEYFCPMGDCLLLAVFRKLQR